MADKANVGIRSNRAYVFRAYLQPLSIPCVAQYCRRRTAFALGAVTQSATAFGFSRPTYYQAEADFQRDGLFGLLPEKRGPRQGHKLTSEVLDFAMQLRTSDPSLRPLDLAAAIQERFAINAHPRSIERALRQQEKKRR